MNCGWTLRIITKNYIIVAKVNMFVLVTHLWRNGIPVWEKKYFQGWKTIKNE